MQALVAGGAKSPILEQTHRLLTKCCSNVTAKDVPQRGVSLPSVGLLQLEFAIDRLQADCSMQRC
jgi:hypothetical protein